ncbi:MAG: Cyclopropane fatty-acyl-phospholipid synthase [Sphingobacteriales bacterium]|nr:Cyclopropane fatty-acyl-phospholipid synthase [Sphingobacteriales bacterium]
MANELTDREFWTNYWESKTDLAIEIDNDYLFHKQLETIVKRDKISTAIELGGFPGYYTIFLKKYLGVSSTLFDYFVHTDILKKVLAKNQLNIDEISVIESDLFTYQSTKNYDLVLSCGLIEHFQDTKDIIKRHIQFLKPGGTLFITLPNFRSVNGWVQRNFDLENYGKHNIDCMDPALLSKICTELGLKVKQAGYWGRYSVWLENKSQKSMLTKVFIKTIWYAGKIFTKVIPIESRLLSPYIIIEAKSIS